jgi:5-methyltetrahydrofolate--homocysteine methyltransferase
MEIIISEKRTILIGERINPSGRRKLLEAFQRGDLEVVKKEAREQVSAGADMLDVNVGEGGVDEAELLPEVMKLVMEEVPVPLCIDSGNPKAIEKAINTYKGKPLVNSVNGKSHSMDIVLPLVKQYGAAVIALPMDEKGIPKEAEGRLRVTEKIINRCSSLGIPMEDIIVDCLALTVGVDFRAGLVALETIERVKKNFGLNMTLGASNISFGLPGRDVINLAFLSLAIAAGVTCPVVNVAKVKPHIMATDLVLGRDSYATRYIRYYRDNKTLFS